MPADSIVFVCACLGTGCPAPRARRLRVSPAMRVLGGFAGGISGSTTAAKPLLQSRVLSDRAKRGIPILSPSGVLHCAPEAYAPYVAGDVTQVW